MFCPQVMPQVLSHACGINLRKAAKVRCNCFYRLEMMHPLDCNRTNLYDCLLPSRRAPPSLCASLISPAHLSPSPFCFPLPFLFPPPLLFTAPPSLPPLHLPPPLSTLPLLPLPFTKPVLKPFGMPKACSLHLNPVVQYYCRLVLCLSRGGRQDG